MLSQKNELKTTDRFEKVYNFVNSKIVFLCERAVLIKEYVIQDYYQVLQNTISRFDHKIHYN